MRKISILFVMIGLFLFNIANAASVKDEYELQERCKKSVDSWFQKKWGGREFHEDKVELHNPDELVDLLRYITYQNHYNRKLNKCFVLEHVTVAPKNNNSYDTYTLFDINENKIYGAFEPYVKSLSGEGIGWVIDMRSSSKINCPDKGTWDELIKPYMAE